MSVVVQKYGKGNAQLQAVKFVGKFVRQKNKPRHGKSWYKAIYRNMARECKKIIASTRYGKCKNMCNLAEGNICKHTRGKYLQAQGNICNLAGKYVQFVSAKNNCSAKHQSAICPKQTPSNSGQVVVVGEVQIRTHPQKGIPYWPMGQ